MYSKLQFGFVVLYLLTALFFVGCVEEGGTPTPTPASTTPTPTPTPTLTSTPPAAPATPTPLPVDEERTLTQYLLLSEELEISGSKVSLNGNIHANKEIKIGDSQVMVNGTKTTSPKVTLPNMADYIPARSEATITLTGDQNLSDPNYPDGSIVWVKDGKLEISGTVSGKVWFLVDKEVVIKGDLIPTNEDSTVSIYSKEKIDVGDSGITVKGLFLAEREVTLSGSDLQLTGLFWARKLVDISGSDSELTGAVISNKLLKVAGSNFTGTYNPVNQL